MSDETSLPTLSDKRSTTSERVAADRGSADAPHTSGSAAASRRATVVEAVLAKLRERRAAPRASYRCQFHNGFGFREAAAIAPYLRDLGISHVYASPILRARPGSEHGYDVCDHEALDPELGGEAAFGELIEALSAHGLGLILDIVPNHMSTHTSNHWWSDVLENGPNSPYAKYFDIDWRPVKPELENKVLLPLLGNQYGTVLESAELRIEYRDGAFYVCYADRSLPMSPRTARPILSARLDELRQSLAAVPEQLAEYESILTALDHLPVASDTSPESTVERQRDKEIIKRRLRELTAAAPAVEQFIAHNVADVNGTAGDPASFDRLDEVLAAQCYRLCHWKAASDEVNYRRFFDINELAAVCMEDPEVFYRSHRLVLRLAAAGSLQGLRIDHIDGLYAPEQYLWRLQWAYLAALIEHVTENEIAADPQVPSAAQRPASDGARSDAATPGEPALRDTALRDTPAVLVELCRRLRLPLPAADDWIALLGPAAAKPALATVDVSEADATASVVDATASEAGVPSMAALDGASSGVPPEALSDAGAALQRPELPLFVVVEKILGPHEPLPESWPVAGTTGYDFLKMCDGLFVAEDGWRHLIRDYQRTTGQTAPFETVARDSKRLILRVSMAGELQMLAHRLNHISEQHRQSRDFTLNLLRFALREILVCFPVYRIYPGPRGVSERDRRFVTQAVAMAKRRNPAVDADVFDFVRDVLLLAHPDGLGEAALREREFFAGRFQQVTSPVMAKGVEDTSFYVYAPLLSVNEVGNGPEAPTTAPGLFHAWNQQRAAAFPQAMLAASTHDTKRSEDVRSRLHVLSEIPREWRAAVQRWVRLNRRRTINVEGVDAPSRGDQYLFFQSLLGVWPAAPLDAEVRASVTERLRAYMSKATHEAKEHTSWISPNEAYDRAVDGFVTGALREKRDNRFLAQFQSFETRIAELGLVNALAELALRLTCPGFPDVYNGQELWSFRLVDPDNRTPVDYTQRRQLLAELQQKAAGGPENMLALARDLAAHPADARVKLYVTWQLLQLRHRLSGIFASGGYSPLSLSGARAEHALAFARTGNQQFGNQQPGNQQSDGRRSVVVIVPRLVARLLDAGSANSADARSLPLGPEVWQDTNIELPADLAGSFVDVLTGVRRQLSGAAALGELFADFPVVVLASA